MPNNLFLSWSGKTSSLIAACFYEKLDYIINEARIFYSKDSITKDEAWFQCIQQELKHVKTGIVFLTRANIREPWILFESGALLGSSKCCVVCCDFPKNELGTLGTPLSNLNATDLLDRDDFWRMVTTLRNALELTVRDEVLRNNLDLKWSEFEAMLREVLANQKEIDKPINEVNVAVPPGLVGKWCLSYPLPDKKFGVEYLEITEDGKYLLLLPSGEWHYYFHIISLQSQEFSIAVQKLQVFDGQISESVHSVEILTFQSEYLITGVDMHGTTLRYERR